MIKIKDLYFIAWLSIKKDVKYSISKEKIFKSKFKNIILVHMSREEYTIYKNEYEKTDKKYFKYMKNLVKKLNEI